LRIHVARVLSPTPPLHLRLYTAKPSNRGEDSIALVVEPPIVQAVPELRTVPRPALTTSVPTLDRILGPFEAGKITLIDSGSDFVFHLTTLLCVRAVMEGREVVFLDGGNSVDPHGMVAVGKRAGMRREEILPRVHVARAFTCHQMTTLVLDMLDKKLEDTAAGFAVFACLPEMYLDEDVPRGEAHQLFQRSLRAIRRTVADREVVGLVTNAGLAKLNRRRSIRRQLYEGADRIVRVLHRKGGVRIERLDTGTAEWYAAVPPNQMTLDDFDHPQPRILGLEEAGGWRGIRSRGYLRFGW
jgi:Rad51